jgi:hypothetical protein
MSVFRTATGLAMLIHCDLLMDINSSSLYHKQIGGGGGGVHTSRSPLSKSSFEFETVWNLENIFEIVLTNHEFECELN